MVEKDLVKILSRWDPSYLEQPKVTEKIKDEIRFSGMAPQQEQLYLMYIDKDLQRLLELARARRVSHHIGQKQSETSSQIGLKNARPKKKVDMI